MRFTTVRRALAAVGTVLVSANVAAAQVIDFEDFTSRGNFANVFQTCNTTSGPINSSTYQGFVWGTSLYTAQTQATGWGCAVSGGGEAVAPAPAGLGGQGYAWNWNGVQSLFIDFLAPTAFTGARFANLSAAYGSNANSMTIYGYDGLGNVIATSSTLNLTSTFQTLSANFAGVNAVEFGADRNAWFSVDDIEVAPSTAVPEPSTWVLMASGLAGVAGFARRRRA